MNAKRENECEYPMLKKKNYKLPTTKKIQTTLMLFNSVKSSKIKKYDMAIIDRLDGV